MRLSVSIYATQSICRYKLNVIPWHHFLCCVPYPAQLLTQFCLDSWMSVSFNFIGYYYNWKRAINVQRTHTNTTRVWWAYSCVYTICLLSLALVACSRVTNRNNATHSANEFNSNLQTMRFNYEKNYRINWFNLSDQCD